MNVNKTATTQKDHSPVAVGLGSPSMMMERAVMVCMLYMATLNNGVETLFPFPFMKTSHVFYFYIAISKSS